MTSVPINAVPSGSCLGAVAIVASAGGIPVLVDIVCRLRPDFPLPIFVAQHLPRMPLPFDETLSWHSRLPVRWAEAGEGGRLHGIYLVPPGTGLRLTPSGVALDTLPPHSTSWLASADRMVESIFARFGRHTAAIVLSGMLPAGVQGIRMVKEGGGITMAQDHRSRHIEMPSAAIDIGKAEIVCGPAGIARVLNLLPNIWSATPVRAA